jgi:hypothetical protein
MAQVALGVPTDGSLRLAPWLLGFAAPLLAAAALALQLRFCFEVRSLSDRLVSSSPERPCDDVRGLDPLSSEPDGDAANFLD